MEEKRQEEDLLYGNNAYVCEDRVAEDQRQTQLEVQTLLSTSFGEFDYGEDQICSKSLEELDDECDSENRIVYKNKSTTEENFKQQMLSSNETSFSYKTRIRRDTLSTNEFTDKQQKYFEKLPPENSSNESLIENQKHHAEIDDRTLAPTIELLKAANDRNRVLEQEKTYLEKRLKDASNISKKVIAEKCAVISKLTVGLEEAQSRFGEILETVEQLSAENLRLKATAEMEKQALMENLTQLKECALNEQLKNHLEIKEDVLLQKIAFLQEISKEYKTKNLELDKLLKLTQEKYNKTSDKLTETQHESQIAKHICEEEFKNNNKLLLHLQATNGVIENLSRELEKEKMKNKALERFCFKKTECSGNVSKLLIRRSSSESRLGVIANLMLEEDYVKNKTIFTELHDVHRLEKQLAETNENLSIHREEIGRLRYSNNKQEMAQRSLIANVKDLEKQLNVRHKELLRSKYQIKRLLEGILKVKKNDGILQQSVITSVERHKKLLKGLKHYRGKLEDLNQRADTEVKKVEEDFIKENRPANGALF